MLQPFFLPLGDGATAAVGKSDLPQRRVQIPFTAHIYSMLFDGSSFNEWAAQPTTTHAVKTALTDTSPARPRRNATCVNILPMNDVNERIRDTFMEVAVSGLRVMNLNNRSFRFLVSAAVVLSIAACAIPPPSRPARTVQQVTPAPAPAPAPAPVDTNLYSYPTKGQSPERADRDRYECHMWAVKQSGFDPSSPDVPPPQRVQVVAGPPPGVNTVGGAVTGAAIGAAVSSPGHAAGGAVVGAVLGGVLGASVDAQNAEESRRVQERVDSQANASTAAWEQKANGYRRAATACLEGRGYNVR